MMSELNQSALPAPAPGAPPSGLTINLFGPITVRIGPHPLPRLRSRKGLWLLALLALRAGRPVERDWLAATLWPEDDEAAARRSLRQSLHDLRLALGPEAARLTGEGPRTLRLDVDGASVDVLAFDAALERGDLASLEAAVRQHRGPLLEDCAEGWSVAERQRREQGYVTALGRLAAAATGCREHAAAASYLQRAVGVDPYREDLQRELMQALVAVGNPAEALIVYRQLRALLWREMAAEPSEETTALFRRLREETRARTAHSAPRSAHPLTPPPGPSDNLPQPLSAFIGRESELREVAACLARARLVTLTGPGGIGKTRLALRVAEEHAGEYADGAWFVDLAPLADAALVPQAVARALQVVEAPGCPLTVTLQEALGARQLLLVLDNCEHLIDPCARLAVALLSSCPHLRILATSRQALGLTGETSWSVSPLSLPPESGEHRPPTPTRRGIEHEQEGWTPDTLLEFEAVRLFVERAAAASSGFVLDEGNAAATLQVCRRLDGIPLALELAAARLRALSIEQIAARLDDRFRLLTGGSRAALPRQQTLRATLDWSYELLSEPERVVMRRLSVFAGGWTLEAAEAVCAGDPIPDWELLELLTSLVEKSLVLYEAGAGGAEGALTRSAGTRGPGPGRCGSAAASAAGQAPGKAGARYRLLETVRQYFGERLLESGEGEATHGRHLQYFLALAEEAEPQLTGPQQGEWLERLETEHDNLGAALSFSIAGGERRGPEVASGLPDEAPRPDGADDRGEAAPLAQYEISHSRAEMGLRLAGALWRYWSTRGYMAEGRERLAEALASAPGATAGRAKALETAGSLAYRQADYRSARSLQEESLAIRRELGDRAGIAASLRNLGLVAYQHGDYVAARSLHEESLALRRELGDRWGFAASLDDLGAVASRQGDHTASRSLREDSLALRRELGDRLGIANSLRRLGLDACQQGDYGVARSLYEESLAIERELGNRLGIASSLHGLGLVAYSRGEYGVARSLQEEGLAIRREQGDRLGIAISLRNLGLLAYQQRDYGDARSLHEESLAIRRESENRWWIADSLHDLGLVAYQQGEYEAARSLYEESLATRRELGYDLGIGQSLHDLGLLAYSEGEYGAARSLQEESLAIRRELGDRPGIAASLEALAALAREGHGQPGAGEGAGERYQEGEATGSAGAAARLFGAAAALREAIGAPVPPCEQEAYHRQVSRAREMLGEEAFAAAWAEGRAMTLDQAIALALRGG